MKTIERLFQYFEYKEVKPTALEKKLGFSNGYLGTMLKRKSSVGADVLEKIVDYFPSINADWLLSGRGEMEIPRQVSMLDGSIAPGADEPSRKFIKEKAYTDRTKSTEKVITENDDIHDDNLMTYEKYRKGHQKGREKIATLGTVILQFAIPYYEIGASAGVDFFFNDLPDTPEDYIMLPYDLKDCIAIPIHGHSMEPEYQSGDIIIMREIRDRLVIEWGTAHVVITEEQRLFKIINKGENGSVVLRSINREYDPMDLEAEKIRKLYKVEAAISKKSI